jgi:DUF1009 family protein
LGLIAGEGVFPLLVARGARSTGRSVACAAFAGIAWPELRAECDRFSWVGVARMGQWIRVLKANGCREAILVGRVRKSSLYNRWRWLQYIPDLRTAKLLIREIRHDKRDHALLLVVARELAGEGITLIDSTRYCLDHLATDGVMTRRQPTERQWADIAFGWELCRTISRFDIGQAMAVLDKDVLAVEALEGTNTMIERAARFCGSGGWTLIKTANAQRDMRLDVPSIGTTTIEKLRAARAGCLVLESGRTIMLEKPKVIELADRYKIAIVGKASDAAPATTTSSTVAPSHPNQPNP